MARPISKVAPDWWDYTTLDPEVLDDAARLSVKDIQQLSRPGFTVTMYETLDEMWLAAALEYVEAWRESTADNPVGICGPIGPTEQLPLVARIVNSLELDVREGHFWGMDEWFIDGLPVDSTHPLSFVKTDRQLCFDRIEQRLRMADAHLHFPLDDLEGYSRSYDQIRCKVMMGGQGDVKHWAFNEPPRRTGRYKDQPPSPGEYRKLKTRQVDLHPMTIMQNARLAAGGHVGIVPTQAATVGPAETWKAGRISIWHPGYHDNPFGIRLTAWMIGKRLADAACPMSLLADHPDVHFHYYRKGIAPVAPDMPLGDTPAR